MPQKIDMIVWTRNRPLQLDLLLRSAKKYFHQMGRCFVIKKSTSTIEDILYDNVRRQNDWANFITETNFRNDILSCLLKCSSLALGNSDDNVFISDVPDIELMEHSAAFSLRLYPGISHCAPAKLAISHPMLRSLIHGKYWWDWRDADPAGCWGYPHPCDSNVYRTPYWISLLNGLHFKNPGTMEDAMNKRRFSPYYLMQCAGSPSLINISNNRVQDTSQCPAGGVGTDELIDIMRSGKRISLDTPIPPADRCHVVLDYEYEDFSW